MVWASGGFLQRQDAGLVALACLICLLAGQGGSRLLAVNRSSAEPLPALRRLAPQAIFGLGFWTAECMLLLSLRPESASLPLCLASLLPAMLAGGALTLPAAAPIALRLPSALFAAALLSMQVAGLRALRLPVTLGPAVAALAVVPPAAAAIACLRGRIPSLAPALMTGALASGHFALLAASSAAQAASIPLPGPPGAIPATALAWVAAGGGILVVAFALAAPIWGAMRTGEGEAQRMRWLLDAPFEGLMLERNGIVADANGAMGILFGGGALTGRRLDSLFTRPVLTSAPLQPSKNELRNPGGIGPRKVEVLWRNAPELNGRIIAVRALPPDRDAQAEIRRVTLFDPLTGLANQDQFEYHLRNTLPHPEGLALLYVDLERFESAYDMHDAQISDEALVQVARRLTLIARKATLIARLGRTGFAVIQPLNDAANDPGALAASIIADLGQPLEGEGHAVAVSACVGVAIHPEGGDTADSLCRSAASALRWAKRQGRARWSLYAPEQDRRLLERERMEKELAVALHEGQFLVHYQPFFDAERLEAAGCEALLRWDHPTRGRISPAEFIPVAEECGLIVEIGKWVLATACAEAARWERDLKIAVNLSPAQFASAQLLDDVAAVLRDTGLSPNRLELEITETTVMTDAAHAARIMTALKALGVSIAMDDFGTGQSSLGNLRKFPFDKIKIDRSFIIDEDADAETIVQTIIAMGRTLGLSVTAEGVETQRQMAMLRYNGCTFMQGHLLSRPVPAGQLDLNGGRPRWMQPGGSVTPLPVRLASAHPL